MDILKGSIWQIVYEKGWCAERPWRRHLLETILWFAGGERGFGRSRALPPEAGLLLLLISASLQPYRDAAS